MRDQMLGRLEIRYAGEEGIDAGGVLRDFYYKISHEMSNAGYALFIQSNLGSETYMPNANSHINHNHLSYFKFCGRIVGKAIYDKELLDIHFTPAFYKAILGKPLSFKDMEAVDEPHYKNLMWMLDNDVTVLDLAFCIDVDKFGLVTEVELVPGGADIAVTNENKAEYIDRVVQVKLVESIKKQVEAFKEGVHELLDPKIISMFDASELELLISGLPEIDLDDLKAHTEYNGYTPSSKQIIWLWRCLRTFSREQLVKFIQFATGTGKVPVGGFAELQGMSGLQKMNIHKAGDASRLPSSHTCFNQVDLPSYESYEQLREALEFAIANTEGFGLA
jgi:E3 ubiquitin-protein ligase HUWE1